MTDDTAGLYMQMRTLADGTEVDTCNLPEGQRICNYCMHLHPAQHIYTGPLTKHDHYNWHHVHTKPFNDVSQLQGERIRTAAVIPGCLGCDGHDDNPWRTGS